jgi:hypothetical protein
VKVARVKIVRFNHCLFRNRRRQPYPAIAVMPIASKLIAAQGQLQLTLFSRKDFQQEVFVPTAAAAFHHRAVLGWMLFQQR